MPRRTEYCPTRRWRCTVVVCVLFAATGGCVLPRWDDAPWPGGFLRRQPEQVLAPDVTRDELVAHLNRNIEKVRGWRSTDVTIHTRTPAGIPVKLEAVLAVEAPYYFRMRARSLVGDEADLGSNGERFWYWMRRGDPYVLTARRDDLPLVQSRLRLPFEPDWLMEALGTVPLDPNDYALDRTGAEEGTVWLVADRTAPGGQPVRQVVQVDTYRGVIAQHSLYDHAGRLIARAVFEDHQPDRRTGAVLPRRVQLDWPQCRTKLALHLGTIEVNPDVPSETWRLPNIRGCPPFDMAQRLREIRVAEEPRTLDPRVAPNWPRREFEPEPPPFEDPQRAGVSHVSVEEPPWDSAPTREEEQQQPKRRSIWPAGGLFRLR